MVALSMSLFLMGALFLEQLMEWCAYIVSSLSGAAWRVLGVSVMC
jgi:hypothetical protein